MNFKLPVVVNKTVGTAGDLVVNNFNGVILSNTSNFRFVLKKLISNKKTLDFFKKNAYKNLDNFFNPNICVNNVVETSK